MTPLLAQIDLSTQPVQYGHIGYAIGLGLSLIMAWLSYRKSNQTAQATENTATTVAAAVAAAQSKECANDHSGLRTILLEQGVNLRAQTELLKTQNENLTKMVNAFSAQAHSLALRDKDVTFHHSEVIRLLNDISDKLKKNS